MSGKEDEDAVFVLGLGVEIVAQDAPDILLCSIAVEEHDDLVKANFAQHIPHRPGIVHSVFELWPLLVLIDADHHSPALAISTLIRRGRDEALGRGLQPALERASSNSPVALEQVGG